MENEIIEKLRNDYKKNQEKRKLLEQKKKRLEFLKNNKLVKEYIALNLELSTMSSYIPSVEDIVHSSFVYKYSHEIKSDNDIFVYLGTYKISYEIDIVHGCENDDLVSRDDICADYSLYQNLETNKVVRMHIKNRDDFEKEHTILFPKTYNYSFFFNKLQKEFIMDSIKYGEERALKKVLGTKK